MDQAAVALKHTPLHAWHLAHGARMIGFGGWDMPVDYGSASGLTGEHLAARTRAALFDISHMGEIEIAGRDALAGLQQITCNDASMLAPGQTQYSALTTPSGTFVDDVVVYRLAAEHFLLMVNAANIEKDYRWIAEHAVSAGDVVAVNSSARYAALAVQGPVALDAVQPLTGVDLARMPRHAFAHGEVAGVRGTISRTGYTGEDGVEILIPPHAAQRVWIALLASGRAAGLMPAGLGARDTLRLEAGLRLYGQDIDETTTVLEAGLGRIVSWTKPVFVGRAALASQRADGLRRRLVGFELVDPGIARAGCDVHVGAELVGHVTSGTQTPYVKKSIGMTYLPIEHTTPGADLIIDIRGRRAKARVVRLPFYKRERAPGA